MQVIFIYYVYEFALYNRIMKPYITRVMKTIYMFPAFYGFMQSIECATQSRNSYNAGQSIDCRAFYRSVETFDSI